MRVDSSGKIHTLHLRHGMLSKPEAQIFGVAGAAAILIALPKNIKELGMVGCNLDDRTGSHLIKFIKQSKYLKMVCVEENNFSQKMRVKIKNLKTQSTNCTIIV